MISSTHDKGLSEYPHSMKFEDDVNRTCVTTVRTVHFQSYILIPTLSGNNPSCTVSEIF